MDNARRSHRKSRRGCTSCKRRHIRCDEFFPQWCVSHSLSHMIKSAADGLTFTFLGSRNCSKRGLSCNITSITFSSNPNVEGANIVLPVARRIESVEFSKSEISMQLSPPYNLSPVGHRLMHHLLHGIGNLQLRGRSKFATWTNQLPALV